MRFLKLSARYFALLSGAIECPKSIDLGLFHSNFPIQEKIYLLKRYHLCYLITRAAVAVDGDGDDDTISPISKLDSSSNTFDVLMFTEMVMRFWRERFLIEGVDA